MTKRCRELQHAYFDKESQERAELPLLVFFATLPLREHISLVNADDGPAAVGNLARVKGLKHICVDLNNIIDALMFLGLESIYQLCAADDNSVCLAVA